VLTVVRSKVFITSLLNSSSPAVFVLPLEPAGAGTNGRNQTAGEGSEFEILSFPLVRISGVKTQRCVAYSL
jgi:hypothetical protein